MTLNVAGRSVVRRDLREKLTGEALYTADLKLPGMLYGGILRSPHPHANIEAVDTTAAEALPGVRSVVTPFDVPPGKLGPDLAILDTRVRFVGDEVAALAADDPDTLRQALQLIRVDYRGLPHVWTQRKPSVPGGGYPPRRQPRDWGRPVPGAGQRRSRLCRGGPGAGGRILYPHPLRGPAGAPGRHGCLERVARVRPDGVEDHPRRSR